MDSEVAAALRESGGVLVRRAHPLLIHRLSRLVRKGTLCSPLPGIVMWPDLRDSPEARTLAGALWCGPDSVVCGLAAARATFWPDCRVDQIALAVPHRAKRARPGWQVAERVIPPDLIVQRGLLRFTAPALTAIDLAGGPLGGDVIDEALRTGQAGLPQLRSALEATAGRRGNRQRARLLHDSRDDPWSEAERELHRLLRSAGIGGWKGNVWIGDDRDGYVADVCFEAERVILEVDGYQTHGNRQAFEDDRRRRNHLVLAGYLVINFTWRQITGDPAWVIDCVLRALGSPGRR